MLLSVVRFLPVGIILFLFNDWCVNGMNTHVSHFEHLTYNVKHVKQQHERVRRSASDSSKLIDLQFQSHGRDFRLRLVPDDTIFHPDLEVFINDEKKDDADLSHIYHGTLHGKRNSVVHGSIINGIFRGVIYDPDKGHYYVEENHDFFGGSMGQSPVAGYRGHSVMYHEKSVKMPDTYSSHEHCGASNGDIMDNMLKFQNSSISEDPSDQSHSRKRRQLDDTKTTCLLYIQTDHILYQEYQNQEKILSKIAEHVKAVNVIYGKTTFTTSTGQPIRNINFKVQRIRINDTESAKRQDNPFRFSNIGVEKYLDLVSLSNHNDYCLAYVFTNRDFANGVLGLAWVASPGGSIGGICEVYKTFSDGSSKSLNSGLITFKNYGSIVPSRVSHITFAHELGHNFGSPHDMGATCTPGESRSSQRKDGNYIMYARATTGKENNNDDFSPCSKRNISLVLEAKKDRCFVRSDEPICGNQIIDDENEECDCGYTDSCQKLGDTCCTPADDSDASARCKLKIGKKCSISQGPCCNGRTCELFSNAEECSPASECQLASFCDPTGTAACPAATIVGNGTKECYSGTKVCVNGECSGSICLSHSELEECTCAVPADSNDRSLLCHTCCQFKGNLSSCRSTGDPAFFSMFMNRTIFLQPGSTCDDYKGYCDIFSKCRLVDTVGPLSYLKQFVLNPELYSTIRLWIIEYWWAVALMGLALVLLMAGFIRICSVHTPSNNPRLPKHKELPGAANLRRRQARAHQQQQQQRSRRRQNPHQGYELSNR